MRAKYCAILTSSNRDICSAANVLLSGVLGEAIAQRDFRRTSAEANLQLVSAIPTVAISKAITKTWGNTLSKAPSISSLGYANQA